MRTRHAEQAALLATLLAVLLMLYAHLHYLVRHSGG
jgi:hypothetical protein